MPRFSVRVAPRLAVALTLSSIALFSPAHSEEAGEGPWWSERADTTLAGAGENAEQLREALGRVPAEQRPGMQFIVENMPKSDAAELSAEFLLENVALAYKARAEMPWGKTVPEDIFLNDVLPYVNVSETREAWRKDFFERFRPVVEDCKTAAEAAQRLNEKMFGIIGVKYSTKRRRADQSPSESIEIGMASCTGLSILLVDACRAVGIPARVVGIPRWPNKRGNHTWAEIWDGSWHFTGACEPNPRGLNHTWFQKDAALAQKDNPRHAIWAASFRRTETPFPMVWSRDADRVSAVNVTDRYAKKAVVPEGFVRLLVNVYDRAGGERIAAKVSVAPAEGEPEAVRRDTKSGTSRDVGADTNDILGFEVPKERRYIVRAEAGDRRGEREVEIESSQKTVSLVLAGDPTVGEDAAPDPAPSAKLPPARRAALRSALDAYFAADANAREKHAFADDLESILREDDAAARSVAWEAYREADLHAEAKQNFKENVVRWKEYESPYVVRSVGTKPDAGWPLFIAMHGGGGTAQRINDQQWRVMQRYYRDQDSVPGYLYLALRAPNNKWNGFYDDYVYPLVTNLIRQFLLFGDVDPDKVFIMGYSHGGYGAFAIGPKIPYRFAAIHSSAAAPTDGETSAKTLRTTVFTYMIGERDLRYGRLKRCQAFDELITKLRGERSDIYPVTMEYKEGFGHGGLPDRDKIRDMYSAKRNASPREITWEMTDTVVRDFFWLAVPDPAKKKEIDAAIKKNAVEVTTTNVAAFALLLDARLVDFERPIQVKLNGEKRTVEAKPSLRTLCDSLLERGDPQLAYTARVSFEVAPTEVAPTASSTGSD